MNIDPAQSALIEIDVQNDFCPAGSLAVDRGDEVIGPLNTLAASLAKVGAKVVATADWHPAGHVSFAGAGGPWPDHCVQGTRGAAFHERLDLRPVSLIIRKGFRPTLDSYSAFFENDRSTATGLEGYLKSLGVDTVLLGGLATDYCVLYSALDAVCSGFKTVVLSDAVRGVGLPAGSIEKAWETMKNAGVVFALSSDITRGV
jgi:nicotinamidase/pyrazinamidase